MKVGSDDWEPRQTRVGLAFLLLGVVLLLWAWGSWAYRTTTTGATREAPFQPPGSVRPDQTRLLTSLPAMLMAALLIGLVFLVGILAIRRWSRGFREGGLRRAAGPTPSDDLWAAHRVPPLELDERDVDEERNEP